MLSVTRFSHDSSVVKRAGPGPAGAEMRPMALPESAVSELLDAFRTGDGVDLTG